MAQENQNQGQEPEEDNGGIPSWIYIAIICFVIFFSRNCGGCSKSSSGKHKNTHKTESVQKHTGLYDQGYSYGEICRSYGTSMTVDEAWDDMTYGHNEFPDGPTPEFKAGFKDGLRGN